MDSSDWFQGMIHEESEIDCSSLSGDMLTCSRPMVEKRLRPPQHQAVKCPRCDSTHTKFCYYNNYSLSQPRYFCKACRRYWTRGGTLRNIPVGGGCRKNKKVIASKKPTDHEQFSSKKNLPIPGSSINSNNPTRLHLSFPDQMHLNNVLYNSLLENQMPIDFMGNGELGMVEGMDDYMARMVAPNINGLYSPYGMPSLDGNGGSFMDTCQRMMLPYGANEDQHAVDVKPNNKSLSLDWKNQGYNSDAGKDTYGYINNLGSWSTTGVMNIIDPPQRIH